MGQVADVLERHSAYFPELKVDPADMRDGVRRASRWLSVRAFGELLVRVADEQHLVELAAQVKLALSIVTHVRADSQHLFPVPHAIEREEAMHLAEWTLGARQRRIHPGKASRWRLPSLRRRGR